MNDVQKTLDTQFQRMAAMQAELDHLTAKQEVRDGDGTTKAP
jgi:hypothetical protein